MWFLEGTTKACQPLGCSSICMVELATYQLEGKVDHWWKTWNKSRALNSQPVEWHEFQRLFMERFIPQSIRLAKAREFKTLKQESLSVEEYDTEFNRLCTYAPYMIPDEREKIRRFVLGLCHPIRQLLKLQIEIYPSYSARVDSAKLTKMDERQDHEAQKRKRKRGQDRRPSSYGGTSGVS